MEFELWGREEARARRDELMELWLRAFAGPPYHVGPEELPRVGGLFDRHTEVPGFRLVAALHRGGVVGFAYGFPRRPGEPWTEEVAASLPRRRRGWLRDAFGFVEIAVDPAFQGLGVGSTLHDRLLGSAGQGRAVLTVHAEAPAVGFYRRRGWRELGRLRASPYLIMGRSLAGR